MMSASSYDENYSLFAPCVAGSGMFTGNFDLLPLYQSESAVSCEAKQNDIDSSKTTVFNPMPLQVRQNVADAVPVDQQDSFLEEYHKTRKHKLFDRCQFDEYAQAIFDKLIPDLVRHQHDLLLFPLRGSRQPGILTKVIAGLPDEHLVIFNYTYATRDTQQSLIERDLLHQLKAKVPEKGVVKIGVIDTAKGGYGSRHLAEMLSTMHAAHFGTQDWSVQFHLLHASHSSPKLSHEIPKFRSDRVYFPWPIFYETDSLLVEDWSEGIGLSVHESGSEFELKRCVEPGRILYRDAETVQVLESESLCDTMTSLAVDAVNRAMLSSPRIQYVKDVWNHDLSVEGEA